MPLFAPGIGVVSGTDPVTVDILQFSGSLVSVSQSEDTMVVTVDATAITSSLSGALKYPTYPIDDGFIQRILTATDATSSLWQTHQGTAPFYSGQTWWRDVSETWKVRDEANVSGGNIFPTVQRFKFYNLDTGDIFQFHDTITYSSNVFESTRLRFADGFQGPLPLVVSPSSGLSGTQIVVSGSNFMPGVGVYSSGSPTASLPIISSSWTVISCTMPAHDVGPVDIVVVNINGMTGTVSGGFFYNFPPPTATSLNPNTGSAVGLNVVVISGSNFTGSYVVWDGAIISSSLSGSTSLTVTAPNHVTGTVTVQVINPTPGGGTASLSYTYQPYQSSTLYSTTLFNVGGYAQGGVSGTGNFSGSWNSTEVTWSGYFDGVSDFQTPKAYTWASSSTGLTFPSSNPKFNMIVKARVTQSGYLNYYETGGPAGNSVRFGLFPNNYDYQGTAYVDGLLICYDHQTDSAVPFHTLRMSVLGPFVWPTPQDPLVIGLQSSGTWQWPGWSGMTSPPYPTPNLTFNPMDGRELEYRLSYDGTYITASIYETGTLVYSRITGTLGTGTVWPGPLHFGAAVSIPGGNNQPSGSRTDIVKITSASISYTGTYYV